MAPGRPGGPRVERRDRGALGLGGAKDPTLRRYARDRGPSAALAERDRVVTLALYPGSFDPFHNGHLEVVERAARIFDEVVIAGLRNPQKARGLFDLGTRRAMVEESITHLDNVRFISMAKLTVEMAKMNRQLSGIETVFIPTSSSYSFIASRLLREVATYGGDVSAFVPAPVAKIMAEQLAKPLEES